MEVGSQFTVPSERHFSGSLKLLIRQDVLAMMGEKTSQVAVRREHFACGNVTLPHRVFIESLEARISENHVCQDWN